MNHIKVNDNPPRSFDIIVQKRSTKNQVTSDISSDSEDECFHDASAKSRQCSISEQRHMPNERKNEKISGPDDIEIVPENFPMQKNGSFIDLPEGIMPGICGEDDDDNEDYVFCFPTLEAAREQANIFAKKVWMASWKATHFYSLPEWLQDNDFLHSGHRPPLPSFTACFKSIFRIHSETGNIWTHMIGCAAFVGLGAYVLTRPAVEVQLLDKLVLLPFFVGAVACLFLSFAFHTMHCHSEKVGLIFSKLDYVGIALLIMGSFVPWVYYGFYCHFAPKVAYITSVCVLGVGCIVASLWNRFGEPRFRPLRAGLFMGLGLSAVIPCGHYFIVNGFMKAMYEASVGWLMLMALLYISGALFYAFRIPERYFPGKCDIWFQSHQIFHTLVVAAAFVHYHGVTEMAVQRLQEGTCEEETDTELLLNLMTGKFVPAKSEL